MNRQSQNRTASTFLPFSRQSGFSLMELIVVIGMLTIVGAMSATVGIETYKSYLFRDQRDAVVLVLQKARSQAINNICLSAACSDGQPHGVHFDTDASFNLTDMVVFQGTVYSAADTNNQVISAEGKVQISGLTDVYFSQLSGNSNPVGNITLSDAAGHNSVISLNTEGQIIWTN